MMLRQWRKYHGDVDNYRNRAEERRRAVGSTAFFSPHRPAPSNAQPWPAPGFSIPAITIPGHPGAPMPPTPPAPMPPMPPAPMQPMPPAPPTPSIGEMLLKKEGWLRKQEDANVVEVSSSNRGGLGFQEKSGLSQRLKQ